MESRTKDLSDEIAMPECYVDVENCDNDATHKVELDGTHSQNLLDNPETRYTCAEHIAWYRQQYVLGRGYQIVFTPLRTCE